MAESRRAYFDRVYTATVCYALTDEDSRVEPGTPAFVNAPIGTPDRWDVAPYATMMSLTDALDEATEAAAELDPSDPLVSQLTAFIAFLREPDRPWLAIQMEPESIAGSGRANVTRDPAVPPRS